LPGSVSLPEIVQVSNVFIFSKVAVGRNYHGKSIGDSNITKLVGGFTPSEKYESQLGWLFPIYRKIKNVPNHQPTKICKISKFGRYKKLKPDG